jgi:hypothetical protein
MARLKISQLDDIFLFPQSCHPFHLQKKILARVSMSLRQASNLAKAIVGHVDQQTKCKPTKARRTAGNKASQ